MSLSGSQKALMYALGGIARGGATRGGYVASHAFIAVGGIHLGTRKSIPNVGVLMASLSITDALEQTPNTCVFTVRGFVPQVGQSVRITIGSLNTGDPLFAGTVLSVEQVYLADNPQHVAHHVNAIDHTWAINERLVLGQYRNYTASAIASDLIARYAPGYTVRNVAPLLPTLDEITFTNTTVTDALGQLAKRIGGYFYVDYARDLHLYVTDESSNVVNPPAPLTPTTRTLRDLVRRRDLSQVVTRVYQEGGGVNAVATVTPGQTMIPVGTDAWYNAAGGVVASGPQRVRYTSVRSGGAGGLVGPGASPTSGPVVLAVDGFGLAAGAYYYAFTFYTASGESLPGPVTGGTTGTVAPPTGALSGSPALGTGVAAGSYDYGVTFATSAGQTTMGPVSARIVADDIIAPVNPPTTAPVLTEVNGIAGSNHYGPAGTLVTVWVTYETASGETTVGPSGTLTTTMNGGNDIHITAIPIGPPAVVRRWLYWNHANNGWNANNIYRLNMGGNTETSITLPTPGFLWDQFHKIGPATNTAGTFTTPRRVLNLSNIPVGGAHVTNRNLYRRLNGAGPFQYCATLNATVTTYIDTVPQTSLGGPAPITNSAGLNQMQVSGITTGPAGTLGRRVYRTTVDGLVLKRLTQIADNTTTTLAAPDAAADASLGVNPPTTDTSGLSGVSAAGTVLAGATSILTSGTGPFSALGGWVLLAGDQAVRYSGVSGNTLIGIPATGSGSVLSTINYGTAIVALTVLAGIPASGVGAILITIKQGDALNILVQVDDAGRQASLAALVGGDGIVEDYQQDNRLSEIEARSRAQARLSLLNQVEESLTYTTRDPNTRSGSSVTATFPAPTNISGTFKIQSVTIGGFEFPTVHPLRQVSASSRRFTFEDLLRLARNGAATPER